MTSINDVSGLCYRRRNGDFKLETTENHKW